MRPEETIARAESQNFFLIHRLRPAVPTVPAHRRRERDLVADDDAEFFFGFTQRIFSRAAQCRNCRAGSKRPYSPGGGSSFSPGGKPLRKRSWAAGRWPGSGKAPASRVDAENVKPLMRGVSGAGGVRMTGCEKAIMGQQQGQNTGAVPVVAWGADKNQGKPAARRDADASQNFRSAVDYAAGPEPQVIVFFIGLDGLCC
jgi:hypothetical protein